MKLDAQRRYGLDDVVDTVVVGTGAGGAPLLARLARAGLKVVALEAGPNWEPHQHPADEVAANEIYWIDERISGGPMPEAFGGNNSGIGVGGSTLHWGAFTPRPDRRDLRLKLELGVAADWPIAHDELIRSILEVERLIGVSGPSDYPWDPGRRYPLPPPKRNASAEIMAAACARLGIRTTDAPAALVSQDFAQEDGPLRQACINCGHCHQGCRNGSKASMDVTFLPAAVRHGAEIRPDARVHTIERDGSGRVTGVVYRQGGRDYRQRCAALILAAGAVETPRLLLHAGLANSSGQVGRNYMAHVATQVWGSFDAETRPNKGYPSSLITEDMVRPRDADFGGGYLVQSLGILPVTWATQVARGRKMWGQDLVDYLHGYNHVAGLGINGECLPYDDNRLDLSDEVDAFGVPKARITFGYKANEMAMTRHAATLMTQIWEAAGASDIWSVERSAHTIGTCRMGTDGDTAVVDPDGRSFDIPNLWICDNSVFPSSLAANPALTIMALSLRTADAMLRDGLG